MVIFSCRDKEYLEERTVHQMFPTSRDGILVIILTL